MKKFYQIFAVTLVVALLLCTAAIGASAAATEGDCGYGVKWSYDTDSCKLTIYGNGQMSRYSYNEVPWNEYVQNIKSVEIQNGVANISYGTFSGCTSLEKVDVSPDNPYFCSQNGVLFNKDKTTLIYYPSSKEGVVYYVPDSVKVIEEFSFASSLLFGYLVIGDQVESIGAEQFGYSSIKEIHFEGTRERWDEITVTSDGEVADLSGFTTLVCESYPSEEELVNKREQEMLDNKIKIMGPVYALEAAIIIFVIIVIITIVIVCVKKKKKKKLKVAQQNTYPMDSTK